MMVTGKMVTGKFSEISNRLRTIRAYCEMTSKAFAESAGVPPKSYSQWESGEFRISIDGALKINQRYGISLDYIYLGKPDTLPHKIASAISTKSSGNIP